MNESITGGLGAALRDRLIDRIRMIERAQALETHPVAEDAAGTLASDAEALLRQVLRTLGDRDCFALAGRVLSGEAVAAGGVSEWTALQELSQAGLVSWDLGTGGVEPPPQLRELHAFLAAAIAEAASG